MYLVVLNVVAWITAAPIFKVIKVINNNNIIDIIIIYYSLSKGTHVL